MAENVYIFTCNYTNDNWLLFETLMIRLKVHGYSIFATSNRWKNGNFSKKVLKSTAVVDMIHRFETIIYNFPTTTQLRKCCTSCINSKQSSMITPQRYISVISYWKKSLFDYVDRERNYFLTGCIRLVFLNNLIAFTDFNILEKT